MTRGITVVVVRHPDELTAHVEAWHALVAAAMEPNIFQEPWMLLPAWRAFGLDRGLWAVLVYGPNPAQPTGAPVLYGLFLLERLTRVERLPVPVMNLWQHQHAFLGTPLIRAGVGQECLGALVGWLRDGPARAPLVRFGEYGAGGAFERELTGFINAGLVANYSPLREYRAWLARGADAESVLARAMSGGNRKELRRQARRLGETGRLETRALAVGDDPEPWLAWFLALERAGWKGIERSALASDEAQRVFFESISRSAHAQDRLMLIGLFRDDRPIALKCNFLALPGAFSFKIAFDEELARFSPGVLLELQNVAALHDMPGWTWMDSCARPGHFMIGRLWPDRRAIATTILSTGRAPGSLVVSALPLLRWAYRRYTRTHRRAHEPDKH